MADESSLPEPHEPQPIRISDAERQAVAERLRDAAAEGRLQLDELDERLESAFGARYAADLVPLVADLPTPAGSVQPTGRSTVAMDLGAEGTATSIAVMGGSDRVGRWTIAERHAAIAVMGGVDLDLRQATFTAHETVINAVAIMGGVQVVVGPDVRLKIEGFGLMGGFGEVRGRREVESEASPDAPLVIVRGLALMGAVEVRRKPPKKRAKREITDGG